MKQNKTENRKNKQAEIYFRDDRLNKELTEAEYNKRMQKDEKDARDYLEFMREQKFDVENDWDDYRDYREMITTIFGHLYLNKNIIREFKDVFVYDEMKLYIDQNYKSII